MRHFLFCNSDSPCEKGCALSTVPQYLMLNRIREGSGSYARKAASNVLLSSSTGRSTLHNLCFCSPQVYQQKSRQTNPLASDTDVTGKLLPPLFPRHRVGPYLCTPPGDPKVCSSPGLNVLENTPRSPVSPGRGIGCLDPGAPRF